MVQNPTKVPTNHYIVVVGGHFSGVLNHSRFGSLKCFDFVCSGWWALWWAFELLQIWEFAMLCLVGVFGVLRVFELFVVIGGHFAGLFNRSRFGSLQCFDCLEYLEC